MKQFLKIQFRKIKDEFVFMSIAATLCACVVLLAPFLCHPNLWIRYGAVGFITVVAQHLNIADVYCKLMPHLNPFITQPIIQVRLQIKTPVLKSITLHSHLNMKMFFFL